MHPGAVNLSKILKIAANDFLSLWSSSQSRQSLLKPLCLPHHLLHTSQHPNDPPVSASPLTPLPPNGSFEYRRPVCDNPIKTRKTQLIRPSTIPSYILHEKPTQAFHSFLEISSSNCYIDPGMCNSLLAALSSNAHFELSKTVFDTMISRGIPLNTVGFGVFIGGFCKVLELEKIMNHLDRIRQRMEGIYGSVIALAVIDGLCRSSRVHDASRALEELRIRGFKPDFIAYRIVVEGLRSMGRVDEVEKFSRQKRKLGVAPRMNEYKEFLFGLISEKRIQEATELGEAIVGGNFPIDDEFLNVLIGSVSSVDPDSAISFCKYMIGKEKFPNLATLSNLSRNLCRSSKMDGMWDIFQLLLSKEYFSDLESYNVMVSLLCKAGRVKEAYSVLKEMRKKGVSPDVLSYNSLMEALCREDLLRPAKKLWDEMFTNGCQGNLQTYGTLIQKFSEVGEVEDAHHLFQHMMEKGVMPDAVTYTSLIKGLIRHAKVNAALEIFNKSMEQDIVLAGSTLNALVFSLCREGSFQVASKVIRGLPPSDINNCNSHVILLKSLADDGEMKMAIEHIEWVRDSSPLKLPAISTELISSLSSSFKPEPVLQLLQLMRERGLVSENDPWFDLCKESFSWK